MTICASDLIHGQWNMESHGLVKWARLSQVTGKPWLKLSDTNFVRNFLVLFVETSMYRLCCLCAHVEGVSDKTEVKPVLYFSLPEILPLTHDSIDLNITTIICTIEFIIPFITMEVSTTLVAFGLCFQWVWRCWRDFSCIKLHSNWCYFEHFYNYLLMLLGDCKYVYSSWMW